MTVPFGMLPGLTDHPTPPTAAAPDSTDQCIAHWTLPLLGTHCADTVIFAGIAIILMLIGLAGIAL